MTSCDIHAAFCENVKRRRQELGITQAEAARRMGISQPYWASIEAGYKDPGLKTIVRVAIVLEIAPFELISGKFPIAT